MIFDGVHSPQNIAIYSFLLGSMFSFGLTQNLILNELSPLSLNLSFLALFHFLEYIPSALYRKNELSLNSFLINHSRDYHLAVTAGILEYLIECYYFPSLKQWSALSRVGLFIAITGQLIRSLGIFTCGKNFHHHIQEHKSQEHQLVKYGIYRFLRHPSYTGFYYWAVGLQIMMLNPISTIAFLYVLQKFFEERIEYEEDCLIRFFGKDYELYRKSSYVLIPFC